FNILLQLLDDGRLTDSQGRTVNFSNTIVVMTSNIGSQAIMDLTGAGATAQIHERVTAALRQHFLPEFLNRIDETIVFHPLGRAELHQIVDLQVARLRRQLQDNKYDLELSTEARDLLTEEGYDPAYGARPLKRTIQQRLQNPLANEILAGNIPEGSTIVVAAKGGEFQFSHRAGMTNDKAQ
ncbi:MAG: AAA family ATPase, partial [Planctomycetaceae bacterium]